MRTLKILSIILIAVLTVSSSLFAQGFQPPAEGKAVVYFARLSAVGAAVSFEYFHQDKYIGVFKGKNYMRYECDPGEQLLWASSENKEFLTTNLKEGGTYVVIVNVKMGGWKARVGFTPISASDTKLFDKAKKMILKKEPKVTPDEKIVKMNEKLAEFITEKLQRYEDKWKHEDNNKFITPDMAIPPEKLK